MQENKDKISIDNAQGKFLLFFPKTTGESEELVSKLQDAGFKARAKSSTPLTSEKIIESGIGVVNGEFFLAPIGIGTARRLVAGCVKQSRSTAIICRPRSA